ncbi:hypothetical protein CVT24_000062 [Panaeolus cyanescens]|uniref:DUF5745 domain-containing protein n=1 Tax=Panaeolus cyanescens TaxID=181874 RepID=A0A409VWD8_9AGAR|nr:hypothetical protein CVT24_000062 [Panaeolus cyanescens]
MPSSLISKLASEDNGLGLTEAELVDQLNNLLFSLNVPLPLVSPADLTPSLLMAILESLLGVKIPLLDGYDSKSPGSARALKVQQMKIFLGVLETDIVQADVGLSAVDPRKLADGDWDEVCFVGQILCWLGRKNGLIDPLGHSAIPMTPPHQTASYLRHRAQEINRSQRTLSPRSLLDLEAKSLFQTQSPSSSSYISRTMPHFLTEVSTGSEAECDDDNASVLSELHLACPPRDRDCSGPSLLFSRPVADQEAQGAQHNTSFDGNTSHNFCFCPPEVAARLPVEHDHPETRSRPPISYSGYIQPAEEEEELASFESTRSFLRTFVPSPEKDTTSRRASVRSQYTRTLELLNERARLLNQLAELKTNG